MRSRSGSDARRARAPATGTAPHPEARQADFLLTLLWSDDASLAARADRAGIDRIGLDLEVLGKADRQRGLGTHVSTHRIESFPAMRRAVARAELFCRINPIHDGSRDEIERVLACGVEVLMLPMFTTEREVETFVRLVDGRAKAVPLLEHRCAAQRVDAIVDVAGLDCLHVGLTDLAISLGVANRFSLLASPIVDRIAAAAHRQGLRLCVGGIGRALDASLPIPADLIYAQYAVLGATGALVSRAFVGPDPSAVDLDVEVLRCRKRIAHWQAAGAPALAAARVRFEREVASRP